MSILCWFCPVCTTMTLLERVERGECAIEPPREDCPQRQQRSPLRAYFWNKRLEWERKQQDPR